MIHQARQSAKFTKLVRRLRGEFQGVPIDIETIVVGILERLWHCTMNNAKRGDIGRLDDETIAEHCGWFGNASDLISALVDCGWIDRTNDDYRLVIHDWHEHAPYFIKKHIDRCGGFVTKPHMGKDFKKSTPDGEGYEVEPPQEGQSERTPNITKHNITKHNVDDWRRVATTDLEFVSEVVASANKFAKLKLHKINRNLIWQVCWIAHEFNSVETLESCLEQLRREGEVSSANPYLATVMLNLCNDPGWDVLKQLVPPAPPPTAKPPPVVSEPVST